jgi:UDP-galactopyranose mutase
MNHQKYKAMAGEEYAKGKIFFIGRFASYKYFKMDQAVD